jgi:hypothetical protein
VAVTPIGRIEAGSALRVTDAAGQTVPVALRGFDHFKP